MISFHRFCKQHNLRYYLLGGTLLGAVRHKGFIPWDDDLDVAMPRSDYNKLLELHSKIPNGFSLSCYDKDDSYIYPFAKYCNNGLIVKEPLYKPFETGVWIDIFPLDFTFKSSIGQRAHFFLVDVFRKLLILRTGAFKLGKRTSVFIKTAIFAHKLSKIIPVSFIFKVFDLLQVSVPRLLSLDSVYANFHGAWGVKETAPVSLFTNPVKYKFEGEHFWGISDAGFWLSKVYGDYMTLPPKHKQISEHIGRIVKVNK